MKSFHESFILKRQSQDYSNNVTYLSAVIYTPPHAVKESSDIREISAFVKGV